MSGEELKAADCPFCGAGLEGPQISVDDTVYWMHPGVVTDKQCLLSGQGFTADQLAAWNRRHPLPEQPQEGESLSSTAALEAEVERLRAIVARVQQAVAYCPPEDMTAREAAIAADLSAGMSLRQISAKHGVGVGTVRGVKSRTFLQEQEKQNG